jgi:hypothetical protein
VYVLDSASIDSLSRAAEQDAYYAERKEKLLQRLFVAENLYLDSPHLNSDLDNTIETIGLINWFKKSVTHSVMPYFEASAAHKKNAARRNLEEQAYAAARATSDEQKQAARNCLDILLDAVKEHLLDGQIGISLVLATLEELDNKLMTRMQQAVEYAGSFAEMIDTMSPKRTNGVEFHYLNPRIIECYGREDEGEQLSAFLEDDRPLCFSVITGPAGAGKSKFVYHYVNPDENCANPDTKMPPGWKAAYLSKRQIERMMSLSNWKYPKDLLLIIDYAGETAEETGVLLHEMRLRQNDTLRGKIRFLLIERQNVSADAYGSLIWPTWFERLCADERKIILQEELLYRFNKNKFEPGEWFLELSPPDEQALRQMARDYVNETGKVLGDEDWHDIYQHAQHIEHPGNSERADARPLIVLFILDAWMNERRFHEWDYAKVLESIVARYERHWRDSLCGGDSERFRSAEWLLLYATIVGGFSFLNDELPRSLDSHKERLSQPGWRTLLCALNGTSEHLDRLQPLEPDLVGECFVLKMIQDNLPSTAWKTLATELWEQNAAATLFFLDRCRQDFVNGQTPFEGLFDNAANHLIPRSVKKKHPALIALFLSNLTASQQLPSAQTTADVLKELSEANKSNAEITLEYARGLFNLTCEQDVSGRERSVKRLEGLAGRYENNAEIASVYEKELLLLKSKRL